MKVVVKEVENEGLESFLGKNVEIYTPTFIFAGCLEGVNDTCVKLTNPHIVYDTGDHAGKAYSNAQKLHRDAYYVATSAVIAFGAAKPL